MSYQLGGLYGGEIWRQKCLFFEDPSKALSTAFISNSARLLRSNGGVEHDKGAGVWRFRAT